MNKTCLSPKFENSYLFDGVLRDNCIVRKLKDVLCLFDTGASYCHMPFKMWKDLGFARSVLEEKADLFRRIGVRLPSLEGLQFDEVPCEREKSILGNGKEAYVFKFVLDWLEFGTIGTGFVKYPNVIVKVIESSDSFFIVGRNVLRPSVHYWDPDLSDKTDGKFYLTFGEEHMRKYLKYNDMKTKFMYLSSEKLLAVNAPNIIDDVKTASIRYKVFDFIDMVDGKNEKRQLYSKTPEPRINRCKYKDGEVYYNYSGSIEKEEDGELYLIDTQENTR